MGVFNWKDTWLSTGCVAAIRCKILPHYYLSFLHYLALHNTWGNLFFCAIGALMHFPFCMISHSSSRDKESIKFILCDNRLDYDADESHWGKMFRLMLAFADCAG